MINQHINPQANLSTTNDERLSEIKNLTPTSTVLSQNDYTYSPVSDIVSWQQQTDSNTPTILNYGYDGADQLASAVRTNTSTHAVVSQSYYGYDKAGNRTTEQVGLGVTAVSYNPLNQISGSGLGGSIPNAPLQFTGSLNKPGTVSVGGIPAAVDANNNFSARVNVTPGTNNVPVVATNVNGYSTTNQYQVVVPGVVPTAPVYDLNGNETDNGKGQTYSWDAKDELVKITYTGGATTEFTYDGLSRRVAIVEKDNTGTITSTRQHLWQGDRIAEERDASNVVQKRFFTQGEQVGATNYYYTLDHLGSVREMTDSSGTIQARYDYDPYGRVTKVSGSLDSDFQYAGYYTHATSGLNLTLFRAYDPTVGRWLSRDPAGEIETDDGDGGTVGGLNLYGYVDNDPMDYTDITGLGKGGRRNLTVNQGGQQLTVKTPLSDIQKALAEAKAAGMSAAHIKALTGLAKVVSRGGSMCLEPLAAGTAIYYASKGDSNAAIDSMLLNIPTTAAATLGPMFRPTPGGPPPSSPYTNGSAANSAPMNPTPPSP